MENQGFLSLRKGHNNDNTGMCGWPKAVGLILKGQNEQAQIEPDTRIKSADGSKTPLAIIAADVSV